VISGLEFLRPFSPMEALTSDGWNVTFIQDQLLRIHSGYDQFITKGGLLFVSGGADLPALTYFDFVLTYDFTSMKWTERQHLTIPRFMHRCQSIAHDSERDRFL
jgi:hypothetical protein